MKITRFLKNGFIVSIILSSHFQAYAAKQPAVETANIQRVSVHDFFRFLENLYATIMNTDPERINFDAIINTFNQFSLQTEEFDNLVKIFLRISMDPNDNIFLQQKKTTLQKYLYCVIKKILDRLASQTLTEQQKLLKKIRKNKTIAVFIYIFLKRFDQNQPQSKELLKSLKKAANHFIATSYKEDWKLWGKNNDLLIFLPLALESRNKKLTQ
ncbi:MAG: hypothetical protein V1855_02065, partial [bacterium]